MTEQEWLACTDPQPMLEFLRGKASDRKLRLFAVACCRAAEKHLGVGKQVHKLINTCEAYANANRHEMKLLGLFRRAGDEVITAQRGRQHLPAGVPGWTFTGDRCDKGMVLETIMAACDPKDARAAALNACLIPADALGPDSVNRIQPTLIRDIFSLLPFRSVAVETFWLTFTVRQLAEAIYQDLAFDRLPILADALEDAGCTNADILNHCRQPGEHVRGCWVVDLLTGRE